MSAEWVRETEPLGGLPEVRWVRRCGRGYVSLSARSIASWSMSFRCLRRFERQGGPDLPAASRCGLDGDGRGVWFEGGSIRRVDPATGVEEQAGAGIETPRWIEVAASDDLVALGYRQGFLTESVSVWCLRTGAELWSAGEAQSVEFSPDGRWLLTQLDVPSQAGGDWLHFAVHVARTGRRLDRWSWDGHLLGNVWWDSTGGRILYGDLGEAPKAAFKVQDPGWPRTNSRPRKGEIIGVHPRRRPPSAVRDWSLLRRPPETA